MVPAEKCSHGQTFPRKMFPWKNVRMDKRRGEGLENIHDFPPEISFSNPSPLQTPIIQFHHHGNFLPGPILTMSNEL
jgi:hypothetical protein